MKQYRKVPIWALIGVAAIACGLVESFTASGPALAQTPTSSELAVPVTVGRVEMRDVPVYLSGIGSVQPLNRVTIKVRVDGQLDQAAFVEGQEVHAGDVLAQIDPRPYQAQLKLAEANKAKDEAQLNNARLDLARLTTLEE